MSIKLLQLAFTNIQKFAFNFRDIHQEPKTISLIDRMLAQIRRAGIVAMRMGRHIKLPRLLDNAKSARTLGSLGLLQNSNSYATEASVQLDNAFKLYELDTGPDTTATLTKDDALQFYGQMQNIRRMESAAANLYREKIIRGFCHLYSGQEACAVGMKAVMRENDSVITAYRCHGWCYLMGITPQAILAELAGRQSGVMRGKGGSMHMYSKNFYGGNGIVGAQVPLGAGIALAHKYKENGAVCFAFYGDGAANQGQIFEAYNISCLLKLPVIYVCENNHYGMGTSQNRSSCNFQYYTRGQYMPGIWVDAMNLLAVRNATTFAIDHVLKNNTPMVLEMDLYRFFGHSMSDPGTSYRSREEVDEVRKKRDPITLFREVCKENQLLTDDELKEIDEKIKKEINEAVEKAKADTEIPLKELFADIYAHNLEPKLRGSLGYSAEHLKLNEKPINI